MLHARRKHIELDYHFVSEKVVNGTLITKYVPATQRLTDNFIKALSNPFLHTLEVWCSDCSHFRLTGSNIETKKEEDDEGCE